MSKFKKFLITSIVIVFGLYVLVVIVYNASGQADRDHKAQNAAQVQSTPTPAAPVAEPPAEPVTESGPYVAPEEPDPSEGATAMCADGTYSYAAHHQGACSWHGGVSEWYW